MKNQNYTTCPKCGSTIPGDAPGGLCPACVLDGAATIAKPTGTGGRRSAPPSVAEIAPHFPDLEIIELLGAGGMGAVYKARQPHLDRTVAIKILSEELAEDPAFAERFNREARVLARLSHPNIVAIFDFGKAGTYCYLLMEYVDGVNLRQAMRTGGFTPPEALALVQEICSALKFAHDEDVLHRDIKPENVLIDSKGRVKIADFGIAKLIGEGEPENITLTLQGSILGSPHYMAPEQFETPGDVDQRADIYSLGVVLYEMLTGELPIGRFALPSEKAAMDTRIDEIVMRTLEKERQARFRSADEFRTEVAALAQSPEAAPPAPAAVRHDDGAARFSLSAAVLTGLSLLAVVGTLYYESVERNYNDRQIGFAIGMILAGGMALVGFILGCRALGEIRKSGGQKDGLGSAVFAVVVWPVLLMGVVGTFLLKFPVSGGGGAPIGPFAIMFCIGIPQILAAFVLVRGLRRWAGGVPSEDGGKRHPGLGRSMLVVSGLIILGSVLATVAPRVLPSKHQATPASLPEDLLWNRRAPELVLPFGIYHNVSGGIVIQFRLVRVDAEGTPEYAEIGSLKKAQRDDSITTSIEIGTTISKMHGPSGESGFTALLTATGESGTLSVESDFEGWDFDKGVTLSIPLEVLAMASGPHTIQIATRRGEDGAEIETLNVEVIVTPL